MRLALGAEEPPPVTNTGDFHAQLPVSATVGPSQSAIHLLYYKLCNCFIGTRGFATLQQCPERLSPYSKEANTTWIAPESGSPYSIITGVTMAYPVLGLNRADQFKCITHVRLKSFFNYIPDSKAHFLKTLTQACITVCMKLPSNFDFCLAEGQVSCVCFQTGRLKITLEYCSLTS